MAYGKGWFDLPTGTKVGYITGDSFNDLYGNKLACRVGDELRNKYYDLIGSVRGNAILDKKGEKIAYIEKDGIYSFEGIDRFAELTKT